MSKTSETQCMSLLPSLLLVLFIGLKLGGVIDWSWWWVLSPFWIPLAIALVCFAIAGAIEYYQGKL